MRQFKLKTKSSAEQIRKQLGMRLSLAMSRTTSLTNEQKKADKGKSALGMDKYTKIKKERETAIKLQREAIEFIDNLPSGSGAKEFPKEMRFMSNFVDGFLKEEYDPNTGELMSADVPPVGERKPQEAYYEYKRRGLTQIGLPETTMTVMDRAESKRIISVMNTLTMKKEGYQIQEKKN